ncbi:MAG TPA: hypothetical protein VEX36_08920 [Thermoleophilaceae bacterium]|nr:hypothetical protein [Thermoleophilaceae bacterium]
MGLIAAAELPRKPPAAEDTFENSCSPHRQFDGDASAIAKAPRYLFPGMSFLHTIGVFQSEESAKEALTAFTTTNNACVLARIKERVLEETGLPAQAWTAPLPLRVPKGFDGSSTRFVGASSDGRRVYFDTAALRRDRSIVVVGYYANSHPSPKLKATLTGSAVRQLSKALDDGT